jgi:histone H3/H4
MSWTLAALTVSAIAMAISTFWGIRNYRQYKMNVLISNDLQKIITAAHENVTKSKKIVGEARDELANHYEEKSQDIFESPELMATIITVLVHKFGDVRLSMKDFLIRDEEYVSVYVDSGSEEIILSLDHELAETNAFMGFSNPDDNTFH